MNKHYYDKIFSTARMRKYFEKYPNEESKAIEHYHLNIELSESFYPLLSIFEVALRNSLNRELITFFGTSDWYLKMVATTGLKNLNGEIKKAQRHIANRKEMVTGSKIVAELTLGFWVQLLNAEYERVLWKPIRRAFPYMEKKIRQRKHVSAPVNKIRNFRNRVFHHEPIAWNSEALKNIHEDILKVIGWISKDLPEISKRSDRASNKINELKVFLNQ